MFIWRVHERTRSGFPWIQKLIKRVVTGFVLFTVYYLPLVAADKIRSRVRASYVAVSLGTLVTVIISLVQLHCLSSFISRQDGDVLICLCVCALTTV